MKEREPLASTNTGSSDRSLMQMISGERLVQTRLAIPIAEPIGGMSRLGKRFGTEALEEFARAANSQHWRNLTPTRFVESTALDSRSRSGDLSTGSMPSVSHAFGILSNDNRYCRARFRSQRLRLAAAKLLSVYRTRSSVGSDGIFSRHRSVGYHHRNWHEYSSLLVLRN